MKLVMLIVEEKSIAETLCFLLKDTFLPVVVEPSHVRDEIIRNRPDIVIVDFLFKNISSYGIVETIVKTIPDVPVIALVDSFGPYSRRLMNLGVYEVIEKPFNPENIIHAMKRAAYFIEARRKEKSEPIVSVGQNFHTQPTENVFSQKLSELITDHFKDPDGFVFSIASLLKVQLSLSGICFFIKEKDEFVFHSGNGVEKKFLNRIRFNQDSALYHWLVSERKIVLKNSQIDSEIIREMKLLKAELILPILNREGQTSGFFAFGSRITGENFTSETIRFLASIATYLSILIEDTFLFQESVVQKEFQKIILEKVPTGIIVFDNQFNVLIFNRQAELILGKKAESVVGSSIESCGAEFASKIRQMVSTKQPVFREEMFLNASKKWLGMSCDFVGKSSETFCTIVIFQDITATKEMENERKRIEQNQYWQQIATQLSHEIKNPLVAIKTFACLLPEKFNDESFRTQFYNIVNSEIQKLTVLVEKIARLADREPLVLNRTDLIEILNRVQKRFPSVEIVSRNGMAFPVEIDGSKLQEAFEFLLDFCIQDTGGKGTIRIFPEKDTEAIEIIIEENGGTINIESSEDVFLPFSDHLNALTSLNLAICRKIIEEHSGGIRLEVLPVDRKRFILKLPVA